MMNTEVEQLKDRILRQHAAQGAKRSHVCAWCLGVEDKPLPWRFRRSDGREFWVHNGECVNVVVEQDAFSIDEVE